jgi:Methyltransferase domain
MHLPRFVLPELLDRLPNDDPNAIAIRRDLKTVNSLSRNIESIAGNLRKFCAEPPRVLIDIGSGDGSAMLRVAKKLAPRWRNVTAILVDQQDAVSQDTRDAFAALGWKAESTVADVFEFLERPRPDKAVMTANLFLHHFEDEPLKRLFAGAARSASLFVACEPRRSRLTLRSSTLLWLIGCSDVSCYDAFASAWAGFRGKELSALWPSEAGWRLHEDKAWLFMQSFVAQRI